MDARSAVVSNCEDASLRAAISQGGVVSFGCSGTIVLTQAITVTTDVVLTGVGALVTISGNDQVRLFNVSPGVEFTIGSLQLTRGIGQHGGAISNDGGRLILNGVTIVSNTATPLLPGSALLVGPGAGGGVYSRGGTVIANGSTFSSNWVYAVNFAVFAPEGASIARGAAICMEGGSLQLTNCLFQGNVAEGAAGRGGSPGTMIARGTDAAGAAIYSDGTATARRCQFLSNRALGGAGVGGDPLAPGFRTGAPGGSVNGGVIHNAGILRLTECTWMDNTASGGQGGPGASAFSQLADAGGSGAGGGFVFGGVILNAGSLAIVNSSVFTNSANAGGGGTAGNGSSGGAGGSGGWGGFAVGTIFTTNLAATYLTNCTMVANSLTGGDGRSGANGSACLGPGCSGGAGGGGGNGGWAAGAGLYFLGGTGAIVHCTFDVNFLAAGTNGLGGAGGPGRIPGGSGAPGVNGTPGAAIGGAVCVVSGNIHAANSIFSNSQGSTNCYGTLVDLGVNICSDTSSCFTNPASLKNIDPGLQPLASNGGQTMTSALSHTSPAYDAGNNAFAPSLDQRGVARPQGRFCDVGAYEIGHLSIEKDGNAARIRYGAPEGAFYRLQGRSNGGDWRDLSGDNARADGYVRFGPIPMTNQVELFRTFKP